MGFLAERAAVRMQTRQRYRTASRMQRRRSWMESKLGMRQDFERKEEPAEAATPVATSAAEPGYMAELERLAQLRDQASSARRSSRPRRSRPPRDMNRVVAKRVKQMVGNLPLSRRKLFSEVARPERRGCLDLEDTRV